MTDPEEDVTRTGELCLSLPRAIFVAVLTAVLAVAGSNFFPIRHQPSQEELHDTAALAQMKEATAQQAAQASVANGIQARMLTLQESIVKACLGSAGVPIFMANNLDCRKK
jgi:hypothetical protein